MYIFIHTHIYACIDTCIYVYVFFNMCVHKYVYTYLYIYLHKYICMYIYICTYQHTYIHIYTCIYMYVYTYIYIHILLTKHVIHVTHPFTLSRAHLCTNLYSLSASHALYKQICCTYTFVGFTYTFTNTFFFYLYFNALIKYEMITYVYIHMYPCTHTNNLSVSSFLYAQGVVLLNLGSQLAHSLPLSLSLFL